MIFPLSYYLHNVNYSTNEKDMKNPLYYFNMGVLVLLFRAFSMGRIAELLITLSLRRGVGRGVKSNTVGLRYFALLSMTWSLFPPQGGGIGRGVKLNTVGLRYFALLSMTWLLFPPQGGELGRGVKLNTVGLRYFALLSMT